MSTTIKNTQQKSALSPFKYRVFTVMWLAALVSNIGTWMHSVGAGWLMTSLSPSAIDIALVQTATTLPVFLFALPAGALADIFNRKTLLILTNIAMLGAAIVFAMIVSFEQVTVNSLLLFTFLLGAGAAFMAPAWQSVIPSMVKSEDLPQAVALGGISINLSRAIGPALAGILISIYGIASPFIANAISFIMIISALWWWQYSPPEISRTRSPEHIGSAMKAGVRFALHSTALKATMWHVFGFMFFANAFWGLLPLLSKEQLAGDATFFGLMMGAIGFGAVAGGLVLPRIKNHLNANQMVIVGTLGTSLVTAFFAITTHQNAALFASLIFGVSWILVLASFNTSAQLALPEWVRARGLAVFLMVFFGSMSLGATFWGWLASVASMQTAMISAAIGGVVFIFFSYQSKLQQSKTDDHSPSHHWPEPASLDRDLYEAGPVKIQICYEIDIKNKNAFLQAIYRLKDIRGRNGSHSWGVYEDTDNESFFIEHFMEDSWEQHLRHHDRVTHADKPLQDAVLAFHKGLTAPKVKHYLAAYPIKGDKS
ncbi:MAG: MFS transporter [Pseudomonadota bacterium]